MEVLAWEISIFAVLFLTKGKCKNILFNYNSVLLEGSQFYEIEFNLFLENYGHGTYWNTSVLFEVSWEI